MTENYVLCILKIPSYDLGRIKVSCIISNITDSLSVKKKTMKDLGLKGLLFTVAIDFSLFLIDVYNFTTVKRINPCLSVCFHYINGIVVRIF